MNHAYRMRMAVKAAALQHATSERTARPVTRKPPVAVVQFARKNPVERCPHDPAMALEAARALDALRAIVWNSEDRRTA